MATVADVAGRFARLDLMKEAQIAIGKTEKAMIAAQIRQRKTAGVDGKGVKFRDYEWQYELWKRTVAGKDTSVVNLTLSETMNNAMFVDVNGDAFTIDSSVTYDLENKYGKDMLGLAPDHIGEYIENHFAPALYEQIEKITGLEMK